MNDSYQMKISKLLIEGEPELLSCDPAATGRACFALANVMGSLLATVIEKKGEETYREVVKQLLGKIDDTARSVHSQARHIADNSDPKREH